MTSRRKFLQAAAGGGVVVVLALEAQHTLPREVAGWLHIGEDGAINVFTGKVEVGQNIRTSLAQVVAEELRVPVERVRLTMGDTDLAPFDAGTFGSLTTRVMSPQLRRVAATAREALIELAAVRWKTPAAGLLVAEGTVKDPASGRALPFADLTRGQKLVRTIGEEGVTPPSGWTVAGTSVPKTNGRAMVTGAHRFPSDLKAPGMLYGKVLRPPAFGATLVSLDTSAAEAVARVVRDGEFVGVAAPTAEAAERALALLTPQWQPVPQPSGGELFEHLKKTAEGAAAPLEDPAAEVTLRATYTLPYIAHVPLETRAALAEWKDGRLTVWTGTQRPFGVRGELAKAFNLSEDRVRVIMPDTGSGYGGKHTGDAALDAARLAKAAGKPVKVVWTRQEEFTWAYFRPAGVIEVGSGARKDGALTSWDFHNYNSGGSGIQSPYQVALRREEFHRSDSPLRQGSYRALAATANHFARETHMDELAHALKLDPLRFRLRNIQEPRLRAVLEAAAGRFAWPHHKASSKRGFGLACGFEKGSYVATCVEIEAEPDAGSFKVLTVVEAFECGAIVNPDHLRNQVEGAILMGLGGALFEKIDFADGKILNPRLARYRVPRFADVPAIETVLLDRKDLPTVGAGETPIVGIAPAVGNAIFDATGIRLRSLPLALRPLERG